MIRKIITVAGLFGVLIMIIAGITDHILLLETKAYLIFLAVGFILFVPMLIRELLLLRKENKEQ